MPDSIDQIFDQYRDSQPVTQDASEEELLEALMPKGGEQQRQPNQQPANNANQRIAGRNTVEERKPDLTSAIDGVGKFIEENISIPVVDFIDNAFQGNQKTPEQISKDRQAARAEGKNQYQQIDQANRQNIGAEPVRVVSGAIRGVGETLLNTAELAGDAYKTNYLGTVLKPLLPVFPSLKRVLNDETQNPFSNKYQWAQWDLGRNELGAQTPVGRLAQGFLEFGLLLAGTGGFRGLPAAGQRFAAATGFGAKSAVVGRAGLQGAISGIPADLIAATRGEGNLSNLIKEWQPSWATPLAIDEDDSAVEVLLKTSLEGAGLGFAFDAAGAYLSGVRATRAALKAGKTEVEAGLIGARDAEKALDLSSPLNSTNPIRPITEADIPALRDWATGKSAFSDESAEAVRSLRRLPVNEQLKAVKEVFTQDRDNYQYLLDTLSIPAQLKARAGTAQTYTDLPNGTRVQWELTQIDLPGIDGAVEVLFDVQDKKLVDQYGRYLVNDFNRIAQELPPGTVVYNTPAPDGYGYGRTASEAQRRRATSGLVKAKDKWLEAAKEQYLKGFPDEEAAEASKYWDTQLTDDTREWEALKYADRGYIPYLSDLIASSGSGNVRASIYRRVGFGPVNASTGQQFAVVRGAPTGNRRWLEPIQDIGKLDEVLELQESMVPRLDRATRIAQESPLSTPDRLDRLAVLRDQSNKGIPVTWDDTAEVVPEYFQAGSRELPADFDQSVYAKLDELRNGTSEGWTIDPFRGIEPESGKMVAIDGEALDSFEPEAVSEFIERNADILSREDVYLGGWVSQQTGKPVIELSRLVDDLDEAKFLGNLFDQEGIFDIDLAKATDFEEGYIKTFGLDQLKTTKGQHLASTFGTPMEPRTVDSTTANAQRLSDGGTGPMQPTVTPAQVRLIANSVGDEPAQILRQMVRDNPVNIRELSQVSKLTEEQVLAEAAKGIQDALGGAGEIDLTQLRYLEGGDELLSRSGIVQVRGLMAELSNRLHEGANSIMQMGEEGMHVAFPQIVRMVDDMKALMRIHKTSANAYGNLLRSYQLKIPLLNIEVSDAIRIPSEQELATSIAKADKTLDDLVEKLATGDLDAKREAMRLVTSLLLADGDASLINGSISKYLREITTGNLLDIMYNSMLSGPKTHLVNTLSNALGTVLRPATAFLGGDKQAKKAAIASFYSFNQTLQESWRLAAKSLKDGPINEGSKDLIRASEIDAKIQILQRAAEVSDDINFKTGVWLLDFTKSIADSPFLNWPTKFLTSSDEFFKTMTARMEFHARTMMQAIDESASSSEPVKATFERLLKNNIERAFDPATGAIKDPTLLASAKEVSFQTDLQGTAALLGAGINQTPLRLFFPFVKTGHNILVYTASHVPLLNNFLSEYKAVMAGDDAYLKAVMKGRVAFGTGLLATATLAATSGTITGNGPPDPNERKVWLTNQPARSINLTKLSNGAIKGENGKDKWMDYSRIEPFGQLLSAVADVADMWSAGRLSEDRAQYLMGYLTYAVASNITNKSYMQGLVPLGQILTPGWQGLTTLQTLPLQVANNFIPLSGTRRTLANALNPYMQEFNGNLFRLAFQATGGFSKSTEDRDWLTGEKIAAPSGGWFNAISPLVIQERGKDPVKDALEDIEFDSSIVVKTISKVKLNAEQRVRMKQLMGESGLYDELKAWVTHPDFKPAVQDYLDRLKSGERLYKENENFYNEITRTIEKYRDGALEQVIAEYPELNQQILDYKSTRMQQRRGQASEAQPQNFENLVNMPLK